MERAHKKLIEAWANDSGIRIQYRTPAGIWVDTERPGWEPDVEYRIKPEEPEQRQPKLREFYYYANASGSVSCYCWNNDTFDNRLFDAGNCFSTRAEAEILAEQIRAVLRGEESEEVKKLRRENEELKIRCENLHKAKECSSLSDGELALIRAIRKAGVADTWESNSAVLVYEDAGDIVSRKDIVAFVTDADDADDDEVRKALYAISWEGCDQR